MTTWRTVATESATAVNHKGRQALPLAPRPGCNRFFAVMAVDGKFVPATGLTPDEAQQAKDSVIVLGLNDPSLSWRRKWYADSILSLPPADKAAFAAGIPFRWALREL